MRPIPSNDGVSIIMCQMNIKLVIIILQELCFLFFWVFFFFLICFYEYNPRVNNFEIMDNECFLFLLFFKLVRKQKIINFITK